MKSDYSSCQNRYWISRCWWTVLLLFCSILCASAEERFPTSADAIKALVNAAKSKDTNAFHSIFGPETHELISVDMVQATEEYDRFVQRLNEQVEPVEQSTNTIVLHMGKDDWPFPIPLVRQNGQWFFDTAAGKEEVLNRRIGRNELGAIQVCQAYVEAQREYAGKDWTGSGILQFAQHLRSTPGTHDGLYWPPQPGEDLSPLGPLIAQARGEGYRRQNKILTDQQVPYHGYYFKILSRQGKHAPAGKYDYVINGHMLAGFALVAWPAEWGNSGIMTFVVNQQGKVYQKNLGSKTAQIAAGMTAYDPDDTWSVAQP